MYNCKNCGGALEYDISLEKLHCAYCGTDYDPYQYDREENDNGVNEQQMFDVTVFTCPQCGGEITTTNLSATGFCTYCGANAVLTSRMGTARRPEAIIPFQKTKEDCRAAYEAFAKRAVYAPKEFRDPVYLDRFRGIYIPYWIYKVRFNDQVTVKGTRSHRDGSYTVTDEYRLTCSVSGDYDGIPYDASSSFDDTIARMIAPYRAKSLRGFTPSILCGYYADTADVASSVYDEDAVETAANYAMRRVEKKLAKGGYTLDIPALPEEKAKLLGAKKEGVTGAMLPVWFLTWRRNDRVAYAIVNGETGKVAADLPVDMRRYLAGTAAMAVVLFLLFNFFLSITAPTALLISSVLALVSGILFYREMRKISSRENHEEDKGFWAADAAEGAGENAAEAFRRSSASKKAAAAHVKKFLNPLDSGSVFQRILRNTGGILAAAAFVFVQSGISELLDEVSPAQRALIGVIPTLAAGAVFFVLTIALAKRVKEKSMIPQAAAAFLAELIAFVILALRPVDDWKYYAGSIACLAAVAVTCFGLIGKYNILSTRPIPSFFDRKGGNDRA